MYTDKSGWKLLNGYVVYLSPAAAIFPFYMYVSDQRERSLITMDFISPSVIFSGVFLFHVQIDPVSVQEGRRPIKPVRIRVATCGYGSCSRTFWSCDYICHFCESHHSRDFQRFKIFLSTCSYFFFFSASTWAMKTVPFFICALRSVCISYYHSDKWIPRQSFGLWCYHSSHSLGVYLCPPPPELNWGTSGAQATFCMQSHY